MHYKELILGCLEENMQSIIEEYSRNYSHWRNWSQKGKKIVVFGAKQMGELCIRYLENMDILVDLVCDNDSASYGEMMISAERNIKVVSVEDAMIELGEREILCFLCTGTEHHKAILEQLEKYNISEIVAKWHFDFYLEIMQSICCKKDSLMDKVGELLGFYDDEESLKIIWAHIAMLFRFESMPEKLRDIKMENLCVRPQYWLENGKYLKEMEQGVIVDCGAFIGDTVGDLVNIVKYSDFEQYDCYEMARPVYEQLNKNLEKMPANVRKKINTYNVGVGEEDTVLKFRYNEKGGSAVFQGGDMDAKIIELDNTYSDKNVAFIKMDIEGSEQRALCGARNIISECHPMCAICVYHSIAAFWEIPRILKKYVPEYSLMLRHHTTYWDDTVCYAKIGEWI